MKIKYYHILAIVVILGAFFIVGRGDEGAVNSVDSSMKSTKTQRVERALTDGERLARMAGVRRHEVNECVIDILKAFETRDKDLIRAAILEWLEKDEELLLSSLGALDNLDQIFGYGFTIPHRLIAQHLYDTYGGEDAMDKIALLDRMSNNVYELTSATLQSWGKGDLDGALKFLKDRPNFDNTWAATQLAYEQAREGDPARVAEFFTEFEGDEQLRSAMLTSVYENWLGAKPDEFAQYVNTLDDPAPAYSALSSYALATTQKDPTVAMEWVDSIKEPGTRESARVSVAAEMALHHPEDFRKWMENHEFSDDRVRNDFIESVEEYTRVANEYSESDIDIETHVNELFEFARQNDPSRNSQ